MLWTIEELKKMEEFKDIPEETLKQKMNAIESAIRGYTNGNEYVESDYIFTWKDGKLFRPDYVTKGFQKVLKKSGFSHMRFHDLRHSCASILHNKGYSLKKFKNGLDIPILKQQVTYMFTF